tara:strand:+ start:48039 stop:48725 length:687 start_codon:yes stop_codon:yes gene_type:complete
MRAPELRDLTIAWLRARHPEAIIVPELSVADWGGASIDVAAITPTHIVGVEIKAEGDSPSRLDLQGAVYPRVAREMWLLPDESIREKCFAKKPSGWGRLEVWDGAVRPWNRATKVARFEERERNGMRWKVGISERDHDRVDPDEAQRLNALCPASMCGTLWRDELAQIALRVGGLRLFGRANVGPLTEAICAQLPAPVIHDLMIEQLRARAWGSKKVVQPPALAEEPR